MDTVLSMVEKDNDIQMHDMVQKYSSGEMSREQYTRILGFKYQEWNYETITLSSCVYLL